MNRTDAVKIIGLGDDFSLNELKKKYRSLMLVAHPDSNMEGDYDYDASEINAAYEYLLENINYHNEYSDKVIHQSIRWNAPINQNAYSSREIFHNIEDSNGNILSKAVIDEGKYEWIEDEEFSLFLLSLYNCSKKIIADYDGRKGLDQSENIKLLSDITYLLAQQFINRETILNCSGKKLQDSDEQIYQFAAMLECEEGSCSFNRGDYLIPAGFSNHRLYVNSILGDRLGYISFKDDRLYYAVIPILERKAAQVKMEIKNAEIKSHNGRRYAEVDMKIRLLAEDKNYMLESINLQIDGILGLSI